VAWDGTGVLRRSSHTWRRRRGKGLNKTLAVRSFQSRVLCHVFGLCFLIMSGSLFLFCRRDFSSSWRTGVIRLLD
jgi:hypothetical protein